MEVVIDEINSLHFTNLKSTCSACSFLKHLPTFFPVYVYMDIPTVHTGKVAQTGGSIGESCRDGLKFSFRNLKRITHTYHMSPTFLSLMRFYPPHSEHSRGPRQHFDIRDLWWWLWGLLYQHRWMFLRCPVCRGHFSCWSSWTTRHPCQIRMALPVWFDTSFGLKPVWHANLLNASWSLA